MGDTEGRAGAEASIDAVPGAWQSHGEPSTNRPATRQGSSWTAEIFVDDFDAEIDLCADRSGFIQRREIMVHIPKYIKRRIMSSSPESQSRGFGDLFDHLNTSGADALRQLVIAYFNDTIPLCGHLKRHSASPPTNETDQGHNPVSQSVPSARLLNPSLISRRVQAAAFNSYENDRRASCFQGTRTKLLEDIKDWMKTDNGRQSIFVLYGVAGIGKSTVSKTVAESAAALKVLGASFFFSRAEEDRKTAKSFFPTLAYHLARYDNEFARHVNEALENDPDAVGQDLRTQFRVLVVKPLQLTASRKLTLIVIDALDECDVHDAEAILSLFVEEISKIPRLKIFITSRPERHIRNHPLARYSDHEQFHLHDIEDSIVKRDISLYLDSRLSEEAVRRALPELVSPWQPAQEEKDILVAMSGKLFIIASTAATFILDSRRLAPAEQLATLLDGVSLHDFSGIEYPSSMGQVYLQILRKARPPHPMGGEWVDEYQRFVGTITLLHEPLPSEALARLLGVDTQDIIRVLSNLHSLLAPSGKDQTFRVHHKSFPDFITNLEHCKAGIEFYIDPKMHNLRVAKCCLRILDHNLRFNMCNLEHSERLKNREELHDRIQNHIPRHIAYACIYWASHLLAGLGPDEKFDEEVKVLLERFATEHLLVWLEVLSIVEKVDTAYHSLNSVYTVVERTQDHTISDMAREIFYDGCRLILRNMQDIKSSPMDIYYSVLPFIPTGTALFRTYKERYLGVVEVVAGTENTWTRLIAVLRVDNDVVRSTCAHAVFSPDGSRLASTAGDAIFLRDGHTGAFVATLHGHLAVVFSMIFSADGSRLMSASYDGMVRLWRGRTGAYIATLGVHSEGAFWYPCVAFSVNGSRFASYSSGNNVHLLDGKTGDHIATLWGHSGAVNSVALSPDGSKVASASHDGTLQLWDGNTGAGIATIEGQFQSQHTIIFSPDGSKFASASSSNMVKLWDGETGTPIATLMVTFEGDNNQNDLTQSRVAAIAFSVDGLRLAGAPGGSDAYLWDCKTCALIATLDSRVDSLVFSTYGSRLASGSFYDIVKLWDGTTGAHIATLEGMNPVFSPDGLRLASTFDDGTVRLWDVKASTQSATVRHHSREIKSVMFSTDGSRLASISYDRTVQLWDGKTGAHLAAIEYQSRSSLHLSVVWSPDGLRFASSFHDNAVQLWDGLTGVPIATVEAVLESVMFSPDSARLLSASNNTVRLWDGKTGAHIGILGGHFKHVDKDSIIYSPDGSRLASASDSKTAQLWDGKTGIHIATLEGHSISIIFSPDSSRLASASRGKTIRLSDGKTGAHIATLAGHSNRINCVIFSQDGSRLASASRDNTVRLWDGRTGVHVATFKHRSRNIGPLTLSPDGARIAALGRGRRAVLRVWDGQTGAHVAFKSHHSTHPIRIKFSADGTRLAVFSPGTAVQLYDCTSGAHETFNCDILAFSSPPNSPNLTILFGRRPNSERYGLLFLKFHDNGHFDLFPFCWLPFDTEPYPLAFDVDAVASKIAVGCGDGRVFLIDISKLLVP